MALTQLAVNRRADETQLEEAVIYFAAAHALREAIRAPLPGIERAEYEACWGLIGAHLSTDLRARAWERGTLTPLKDLLFQGIPSMYA